MKQYIDSQEHWEDSINADIERDKQMEREQQRQIEKQISEQPQQEESFISSNLPVISSVCECVYEYNDDHHPLLVWQCPKCEQDEKQTDL